MAVQADVQIAVRNYKPDDFDQVLYVMRQSNAADGEDGELEADDLRHQFEAPYYDAAHDMFLAVKADGQIVAMCDIELDAANGRAFGTGAVLPTYRRQGIGQMLLRRADARAIERLRDEAPADAAIYIRRWTSEQAAGTCALLESEGYRLARYFYTMHIDLAHAPSPQALPEGVELRPFDATAQARQVFEADMEAFSDHWGFAPLPFDEWAYEMIQGAFFDASLWHVAWDGDQIAGVCLCSRYESNQPDLGWVMHLAVRSPWRKRGLGLGLLTHAFKVFQERGFERAGLGVDADSTTNAVSLYERAGMHVHKRSVSYWKDIERG
jgi:mycothiol synthase